VQLVSLGKDTTGKERFSILQPLANEQTPQYSWKFSLQFSYEAYRHVGPFCAVQPSSCGSYDFVLCCSFKAQWLYVPPPTSTLIKKSAVCSHGVFLSHMSLAVNKYYYPIQRKRPAFFVAQMTCLFPCDTNWIFKHYLDELKSSKS
jgi:hypothetical protein